MENTNQQEYFIQAKVLMGQGKYEESLKYLGKAEQENRLNIDYYITKGIAHANLSEFEKSQVEFEKALKVNKKEGIVYFHLGNIELLNGSKAKGIEYYNNAVAYGFDDAQLYFSLGLMYEEDGEDSLAIRNYTKAISKDPLRADIRVRKAKLYIKNEKLNEAIQTLDELILSNPDVFEGYHLKFLILSSLEKFDEAEKITNEAMKLFPKDTGFALDRASLMVSRKEYNKALAYLVEIEKTMKVDKATAHDIAMARASIYAYLQDMNKTIESLERAKTLALEFETPTIDYDAMYMLMNCYLSEQQYEIVAEYARELKKGQEDKYYTLVAYYYEPFALKKMGNAETAKSMFIEAVSHLRSVSLRKPGNMDSYAFRILCLREISEFDSALELADYLITIQEDSSEAHVLRAAILEDLGRSDEAKVERAKGSDEGVLSKLISSSL